MEATKEAKPGSSTPLVLVAAPTTQPKTLQ